jgi:hypothetical protein
MAIDAPPEAHCKSNAVGRTHTEQFGNRRLFLRGDRRDYRAPLSTCSHSASNFIRVGSSCTIGRWC